MTSHQSTPAPNRATGIVRPIAGFATQHLFGLDFVSETSIAELAASLFDERDVGGWRCVVTPNVDHIVRYDRIPAEFAVARDAVLVLPDGMPIVWASRLLRRPLRSRLAGSDLFPALWSKLAAAGVPTVVVASSRETAEMLATEHGGARFVVPPMFDVANEQAVERLIDEIDAGVAAIGARFVLVGLSMPKHHLVAAHLRLRWTNSHAAPTVLLLGASAELYLGLLRRSPRWMQRTGLEWLYRLLSEPRRLAKRYLVEDTRFLVILWKAGRAKRR